MSDKGNLLTAITQEIERCAVLRTEYEQVPAGKWGAMMIQHAIDNGHLAIQSGDIVELVTALKELQECE